MPKYYEDKEVDNHPCAGVKEDLKSCLLESACVLQIDRSRVRVRLRIKMPLIQKEGKTPKQCLKDGHCRALQLTFFECKRSILDNRARFRGRKGY